MIFFDTETCGFHGMAVLLQWAKDDGEIHLYELWKNPIKDTLKLIEEIASDSVVGFNLTFDWFHLCKIYTVFSLVPDHSAHPDELIDEIGLLEPFGRNGLCLKPVKALDLMLFARKGPYQSTMNRADIRIRRVPTSLAWKLAKELEQSIELSDIYFSKKKNPFEPKWKIFDAKKEGEIDPDFKDIVLGFRSSHALKILAEFALGEKPEFLFEDIAIEKKLLPVEFGYAPFARCIGNIDNWKETWPSVIKHHINHWAFSDKARHYAEKDVDYTRRLWYKFDKPEAGDDDSELACMVGAVRWKGFTIDIKATKELKKQALQKMKEAPRAPNQVRKYLEEVLNDTEKLALTDIHGIPTTKRIILEELEKWDDHPVAKRATAVLNSRKAKWEKDLYDKLLRAGKFHASFKVIGALSSRMSGDDDLNPQGIKNTTEIRRVFSMADKDMVLCGGDFKAFEVVLFDADCNDPVLHADLLTGKKIHGIFGQLMWPGKSYEDILATKATENDLYTKSKSGVFAIFYGGDASTLKSRLGVDIEAGQVAYDAIMAKYKGVNRQRQETFDKFCSMRQPRGVGTQVIWHEPNDFIESMFGFKRFFTLENKICKAIFELANKVPESWKNTKVKVHRRDRIQTAFGATQSALYAAAFSIQAANMRAAINHRIQSSGAQITKKVQRKIWDLQPPGINEWIVQPLNVHDEILCVTKPNYVKKVNETVQQTVADLRSQVPLLEIDWSDCLESWANK